MPELRPSLRAVSEELSRLAAMAYIPPACFVAAVVDAFQTAGLSLPEAEIAAEVATHAQLCGSDSHGVVSLPLYLTGLLQGTINRSPQFHIQRRKCGTSVLDADHALGLVAGCKALDLAVDIATEFGIGAVAVRNSSHFGTAGYFAERAARRGLLAMAFSNAAPAIAPTNGKLALLGTNPIGAGVPVPAHAPIVLDMATSVVARSRIRQALANGETTIPEGWAFDNTGLPTSDPRAAVEGSLMPIGGPKGYGLSLLIEILCSALSDGQPGFDVTYEEVVRRPSGICHFFLAIDPDGFAGRETVGRRIAHIAKTIEDSPAIANHSEKPRLPGARGQVARDAILKSGVRVQKNLKSALRRTAKILEDHTSCA